MVGKVGSGALSAARGERMLGEKGETLIEVLMTVTIVAMGVVALITSIGSTFRLSGTSRVAEHGDQLLVRYAESLVAVPYEACAPGVTPYQAAATSAIPSANLPDGVTAGSPGTAAGQSTAFELSISSIGYWNGDLSPATFRSTCPASDAGSQQLTLFVHAGDGSFDRHLMIVKRAP